MLLTIVQHIIPSSDRTFFRAPCFFTGAQKKKKKKRCQPCLSSYLLTYIHFSQKDIIRPESFTWIQLGSNKKKTKANLGLHDFRVSRNLQKWRKVYSW